VRTSISFFNHVLFDWCGRPRAYYTLLLVNSNPQKLCLSQYHISEVDNYLC